MEAQITKAMEVIQISITRIHVLHLSEAINPITLFSLFTECIGFAVLIDSPKSVRSIKRGQIVMRLIASRALDKVGPSICVFSASIGRIMHDTGLIVASRITVRAIPVVVIEMNGMPMARHFPFGSLEKR